jgi:hypothetical protein
LSQIREGSSTFTRAFTDIARAGTRLISADQTLSALTQHTLRGALREQQSSALLTSLTQHAIDDDSSTVHSGSSISAGGRSVRRPQQQPSEFSTEFLETDLIVQKGLSFQKTQLPSLLRLDDTAHQQSSEIELAEAELCNEVLSAIEERESAVLSLGQAANELQAIYFDQGLSAASIARERFEECLQLVRQCTLTACDAYGAWSRVYLRERERKHKRQQLQQQEQARINGEESLDNKNRTYCVIIAFNESGVLIPTSMEVQSTMKKFRRGREQAKKPLTLKYVGVFPKKQLALEAFQLAMRSLPEEHKLMEDINKESDNIDTSYCSLRHCLRHYLIRNHGVNAFIPCEQCESEQQIKNKMRDQDSLYANQQLPAFVYRGESYFDRIWNDCELAIGNCDVVEKLFPNTSMSNNPLLLDENTNELIRDMVIESSHQRDRKPKSGKKRQLSTQTDLVNSKDPLSLLKGRRELLHNALSFSKTYIQQKAQEKALAKYSNHPWQPNRTLDHLPALVVNNTTTVSRSVSEDRDSTMRKLFGSQSAGQLTFPKKTVSSSFDAFLLNEMQWIDGVSTERLTRAFRILSQTKPYIASSSKRQFEEVNNKSQIPPSTTTKSQSISAGHTSTVPIKTVSSAAQFHTTEIVMKTALSSVDTKTHKSIVQDAYDFASLFALLKPKHENTDTSHRDRLLTTTQIVDRGIAQEVLLSGYTDAFRTSDRFVRGDEGEFVGLARGRATRTIAMREDKEQEGERRLAFRKRLQTMLRQSIQIPYYECDIRHMNRLIEIAQQTKSATLSLDLIQAENYVRNYFASIQWSIQAQRVFRGNRAREMVRQILFARERIIIHKNTTRSEAFQLARQLIPNLTQTTTDRIHRKLTRRYQFSFVLNISGFHCLVRVLESTRTFRRPIDQCLACQSVLQRQRARAREKDMEEELQRDQASIAHKLMRQVEKERVRTLRRERQQQQQSQQQLHLSQKQGGGLRQSNNEHKTINIADDICQHERDRIYGEHYFCFCADEQQPEHCLLRFFIPALSQSFSRKFSISQVKEVVLFLERERQRLSNIESVISYLRGDLNELEPLFPHVVNHLNELSVPQGSTNSDVHNHTVPRSFSQAWLQCGRESAVLPRLPPSLPTELIQLLDSDRGQLEEEVQSEVKNGSMRTVKTYDSVTTINALLSTDTNIATDKSLQWRWEPLHQLNRLDQTLHLLSQRIARELKTLDQKVVECGMAREEVITQTLNTERALMSWEDSLTKATVLSEELFIVQTRQEEIFAFQRALIEETTSLERQQRFEVVRSYDHKEDGSVWRELHVLKKLEKETQRAVDVLTERVGELNEAMTTWQKQRTVSQNNEKDLLYRQELVKKLQCEHEHLKSDRQQVREHLRLTLRMFLSGFSMPTKQSLYGARGLHILPLSHVFVRDPRDRLGENYRELCDTLHVRALRIISSHSAVSACQVYCVVSVLRDSMSGNVLLSLRGLSESNVVVEESIQNEDIAIDSNVFYATHPLRAGNSQEIALSSDELRDVLAHSIDYKHTSKSADKEEIALQHRRQQRIVDSMFVLPSQRMRSLTVTIIPSEHTVRRAGTWTKRIREKNTELENMAKTLVQHLRMNPHTQRPCVGLLHFSRRRNFTLSRLNGAMWWQDMQSSNPIRLTHLVADTLHTYRDKERLRIRILEHLFRFDIIVTSTRPSLERKAFRIRVSVDMRDVLLAMLHTSSLTSTSTALQVSAMLTACTAASLAPSLRQLLIQRTMTVMSGRQRHRLWWQLETPPAMCFHPHNEQSFESVFRCQRVLCGLFVRVNLRVSVRSGDWKCEISRPDDWADVDDPESMDFENEAESRRNRNYWAHSYRSHPITISLTRAEVLALTLRYFQASALHDVGSEKHWVSILHPHNINILCNSVLDSLSYVEGLSNHAYVSQSLKAQHSNEVILDDLQPFLPADTCAVLNIRDMKRFISLSVSRYNHWCALRYPLHQHHMLVNDRDREILNHQCDVLTKSPKWSFRQPSFPSVTSGGSLINKNNAKVEQALLQVHKALWGFKLNQHHQVTPTLTNVKDTAYEFKPEDEDGDEEANYYRVTMHTTLDTETLCVSACPAALRSGTITGDIHPQNSEELEEARETERLLLIAERASMTAEDVRCQNVQKLEHYFISIESESKLIGDRQSKAASVHEELQRLTTLELQQHRNRTNEIARLNATLSRFANDLLTSLNSLLYKPSPTATAIFNFIDGTDSIEFYLSFHCDVMEELSTRQRETIFAVQHSSADTQTFRNASQWTRSSTIYDAGDHSSLTYDALISRRVLRILRVNGRNGTRDCIVQRESILRNGSARFEIMDALTQNKVALVVHPSRIVDKTEHANRDDVHTIVYSAFDQIEERRLTSLRSTTESDEPSADVVNPTLKTTTSGFCDDLVSWTHDRSPFAVIAGLVAPTCRNQLLRGAGDKNKFKVEDDQDQCDDHNDDGEMSRLGRWLRPGGKSSTTMFVLNPLTAVSLAVLPRTRQRNGRGGPTGPTPSQNPREATNKNSITVVPNATEQQPPQPQQSHFLFIPYDELTPHSEWTTDFAQTQMTIKECFLSYYDNVHETRRREKVVCAAEDVDVGSVADSLSVTSDATLNYVAAHHPQPHAQSNVCSSSQPRDIALQRAVLPHMLLYSPTAERKRENVRVRRLLQSLSRLPLHILFDADHSAPDHTGSDSDNHSDSDDIDEQASNVSDPPLGPLVSCRGDAVLLVRGGTRALKQLSTILSRWHQELLPRLALRQARQGRERAFRRDNHAIYRDMLLSLATAWKTTVERLFFRSRAPLLINTHKVRNALSTLFQKLYL